MSLSPSHLTRLLHDPGIIKLAAIIPASHDTLRLVGGCVRDALAGLSPMDMDLSTLYPPSSLGKILSENGIPFGRMGEAYGTLSVFLNNKTYDITTCREDTHPDGRGGVVNYTQSWEKDAQRRDFTFNALYVTLAGEVIDFFGGQEDLRRGIVRFIGDPGQRLKEDYLRLLRYYRFWARFGKGEPCPDLIPFFQEAVYHMDRLSNERIRQELLPLLIHHPMHWPFLATHFNDLGIWQALWAMDASNTSPPVPLSLAGRLVSLFGHGARACAVRLAMQVPEKKALDALLQAHETHQSEEDFFTIRDTWGDDCAKDWAYLREKPHLIKRLTQPLPPFPLTAKTLMDMGIHGVKLGDTLKKTRVFWRKNQGTPDATACLDFALKTIDNGT